MNYAGERYGELSCAARARLRPEQRAARTLAT